MTGCLYESDIVTQETPDSSVRQFVKQQTRWSLGFIRSWPRPSGRCCRPSGSELGPSYAGIPGLPPDELRHTAASLALKAGANVKGVQQMLGHVSGAMALDVYAGLLADNLDNADRLDHAFEGLPADLVRTIGRTSGEASLDCRHQTAAG